MGFSRQEYWSGLPFPSPRYGLEKYNKEVENIRKFQTELTELKNTITELKNTLKDIYSKLDNAAEKATAPHSSTLA